MGTTYRFIEEPEKPSNVLEWFRSLPQPPIEHSRDHGVNFYFQEMGPLEHAANGLIDASKSPVVNVFLPRVKRGVLWTVGEVHFLASPLRQMFPNLHKISSEFSRWLSTHECVFTNKSSLNQYDYYLEGSVRNYDPPVFALDSGFAAIRAGRYFVAEADSDCRLHEVCRTLALRGIDCAKC